MNWCKIENYEYKGYVYELYVDIFEDNMKYYYDITTPDGETIIFDWSPYCAPRKFDFTLWVDLGCPPRVKNTKVSVPLEREHLMIMKNNLVKNDGGNE